jgi:hypothetical protein
VIILSTNSLADASAGRGGSAGFATGAAGIVSGRDVATVSLRAIGF